MVTETIRLQPGRVHVQPLGQALHDPTRILACRHLVIVSGRLDELLQLCAEQPGFVQDPETERVLIAPIRHGLANGLVTRRGLRIILACLVEHLVKRSKDVHPGHVIAIPMNKRSSRLVGLFPRRVRLEDRVARLTEGDNVDNLPRTTQVERSDQDFGEERVDGEMEHLSTDRSDGKRCARGNSLELHQLAERLDDCRRAAKVSGARNIPCRRPTHD